MTPEEHQRLERRYEEIDRQIDDLHAGKVVNGDPAEIEQELLGEQDEIEFELGEDWFDRRKS